MRGDPISARVTLLAALVSSFAAVTCGGRSQLATPGGSSGATAGTGGSAGSVAGRGGASSGGAVGAGGVSSGGASSGGVSSGGAAGSGGAVGSSGTSGASGSGGNCDRDCEGGECSNGACKPVTLWKAQNLSHKPSVLALDDDYVYWARPIMRVPKSGGMSQFITEDMVDGVFGIAVDDSHVFWGTPSFGPVRRVPKGGGALQALTMENVGANRIAADASGVYFTGSAFSSSGVYHMHHDGSGLRKLTPEGDSGIAIDEEFVYFALSTKNELYRMGKDGSDPTLIATAPLPYEVDQYGDFVVFNARGDRSIRRVPKRGGPTTVVTSMAGERIAADADGVYFSDVEFRRILYVPIDGFPSGESLVVAEANGRLGAIAVDDTRIFWTVDYGGVFKIVKPPAIRSSGMR
jgi:hypothetical protein